MQYVEMLAGMIFSEKLSDGDIGKWSNKQQKLSEWLQIAEMASQVYVEMTKLFGLVVLALDDISCMDEMSWHVVRQLHEKAKSKFFIMGAARGEHGLNLQAGDWKELKGSNFFHLKLGPMTEKEISNLTRKISLIETKEIEAISRTIYFLSEGNPLLAGEITEIFSSPQKDFPRQSANIPEGASELLLNRLDSLPPSTRLYIQCGAILGQTFSLSDVVAVMERYNGISTSAEAKAEHELDVQHNLDEAQKTGFLSSKSSQQMDDTQTILYTFSHKLLREVISKHILQEFKDKINRQIDYIKKKSSDSLTYQHHEFCRDISDKALPVRSA